MELDIREKEYIHKLAKNARAAGVKLRTIRTAQKNDALRELAGLLDSERAEIKNINTQDIEIAQEEGLSPAMIDRLLLSDKVIDSMIRSLLEIAALKDPVGEIISGGTLSNGLELKKIRVPIGVVGIIYESRPNVTVDVGALGLKSSNAVILRGGKEAIHSNKKLAALFQKALHDNNIPSAAVQLVEHTNRAVMAEMLRLKKDIDLIVPRGGEGLINFVDENSLIPVIKHDKGVCHIYLHSSADIKKAIPVILNSKVQRPGVCNAAETLLIDKAHPHAADAINALLKAGVVLHGDTMTREHYSSFPVQNLMEEGYHREYLSLDISIKAVDNLEAALHHIEEYSSGHSEAILAEDYSVIGEFLRRLDSAALFVNASTRFHDGGQFGMGAEVGISTGKLHCRGPMGLADLTTTKYIVTGDGQIRD